MVLSGCTDHEGSGDTPMRCECAPKQRHINGQRRGGAQRVKMQVAKADTSLKQGRKGNRRRSN